MEYNGNSLGESIADSEDLLFESSFINIGTKSRDRFYDFMIETYGLSRIMDNGYKQRTKHEVYTGISEINKLGISLEAKIYNLPVTVLSSRGKPAETAFTDRSPELRNIYLVPDHTPSRIVKNQAYHKNGIEEAVLDGKIDIETAEKWIKSLEQLDISHRVAASILHEHGHILMYNIMDKLEIKNKMELYDWLELTGYLDNCSQRVVSFSQQSPNVQINIAMEEFAEDYRISHYMSSINDTCCLPHSISYIQDIINPDCFMRGVEIVGNLLKFKTGKKTGDYAQQQLENILPFGEADRCDSIMRCFTHGTPVPLTKEDKLRAREQLRKELESIN